MSTSMYSNPAYYSNAPEVNDFRGEFVYRSYEHEETRSVGPKEEYKYTVLSWKNPFQSFSNEILPQVQGTNPLIIENNLQKIVYEGIFNNSGMTSVMLKDQNYPKRIYDLVKSLKERDLLGNISADERVTSLDINQPLEDSSNELLAEKLNFNLNVVISNSVFSDIFQNTQNDVFSQFGTELDEAINAILPDSRQILSSGFEPPNIGSSYSLETNKKIFQKCGFLINKFSVNNDGGLSSSERIVIDNTQISEYIDTHILYGKTYVYEIRSVIQAFIPSVNQQNGRLIWLKVLVASKPSQAIVRCEEFIPPPPPDDIRFTWSKHSESLTIHWNMPVNPQQDIKRVQIFRRSSADHPFELISEYRFNDNSSPTIETGTPENIPENLVKVLESKKNVEKSFIDEDFKIGSRFIYALCSIDAHFLTSNYSSQFEVYFDKINNKLIKKSISPSGAPKPYPNFYLDNDPLVQSTATLSGNKSKNMKFVFGPDFLKIKKPTNIPTYDILNRGRQFLFKFINLDNQKEVSLITKIKQNN